MRFPNGEQVYIQRGGERGGRGCVAQSERGMACVAEAEAPRGGGTRTTSTRFTHHDQQSGETEPTRPRQRTKQANRSSFFFFFFAKTGSVSVCACLCLCACLVSLLVQLHLCVTQRAPCDFST